MFTLFKSVSEFCFRTETNPQRCFYGTILSRKDRNALNPYMKTFDDNYFVVKSEEFPIMERAIALVQSERGEALFHLAYMRDFKFQDCCLFVSQDFSDNFFLKTYAVINGVHIGGVPSVTFAVKSPSFYATDVINMLLPDSARYIRACDEEQIGLPGSEHGYINVKASRLDALYYAIPDVMTFWRVVAQRNLD